MEQIQELETKIEILNRRIAEILKRSEQQQNEIFTSAVIALREASQVQSDESLKWGLSAIEDNSNSCETLDQSEADMLSDLALQFKEKGQDWTTAISSIVKRMMSGWKMPEFIRRGVEE